MAPTKNEPEPHKPTPEERDEPVKIDLPFEEAVRGLLEVDPDSEPVEEGGDESHR